MGDGVDSNSGRTSQTRILGDGRIEVTEFVDGVLVSRTTTDAGDAHDWTTIERHYDATGECLKLCVSERAHAVFRYGQAPKRPANIMAS